MNDLHERTGAIARLTDSEYIKVLIFLGNQTAHELRNTIAVRHHLLINHRENWRNRAKIKKGS